MRKEFEIYDRFIEEKGLRHTPQREVILRVFLSCEKHLSVEELHKLVQKEERGIGYVTVYRAMKLFAAFGLCQELDLGDGVARFEHKYGHRHHDHLICIKCGKLIEVVDNKIEKLQDKMAKKYKFTPTAHKLEIFGACAMCKG